MTQDLPTTTPTVRLALELRHDDDRRYRWYQMTDDADTEVSGDTPEEAWDNAAAVWRSAVWNFERISDTIAEIDGDYPPESQPDPLDVKTAKRLLEEAASNHGEEVHSRYAGSCWRDRNDAIIEIQNHADPDETVLQIWGD